MHDDERAIRTLVDTWLAATEAGDADAVLGLMTDDVVFTVAGREPFGKAVFADGMRAMKDVRIETKSDLQEITVVGDWAWLRNHLRVTVTPPGKEAMRRAGYTLTVLQRRADGTWAIARDANMLTAEQAPVAR
jgi:uncharacterized protein (TIGR02246 family)